MNTDFYSPDLDDSTIDEGEMDYPIRPQLHRIILDLLLSPTFRIPKSVTKVRIYKDKNAFAVCPRCDSSMEYEYQLYRGRCGQHLVWSTFDEAEEEFIGWNGTEPADDEGDEDDSVY